VRHPFGVAVWGTVAGPWRPPTDDEPVLGDDPWNKALGLLSQGLLKLNGGLPTGGERELIESLRLFRALGERWGTAQALDSLAQVAGWRGEWDRAHELWEETLKLSDELGALEECVDVLSRQARCLMCQGDLDLAAAGYERAAVLSAQAGRVGVPAETQLGLGEIARLRGDSRAAAERLAAALEVTKPGGFGVDAVKARVLTALARLAASPAEALRLHGEALAVARPLPFTAEIASAAEGQADAALLTGSGERSALLLGVAVALRGMSMAGDADVSRIAGAARDDVGQGVFAEAFSRGAAMSHEEALTVLGDIVD
jgi:tetratricopeptide (TPR) repeat protein